MTSRRSGTQHRDPSGALHREELMGEEGSSSDSSLLGVVEVHPQEGAGS